MSASLEAELARFAAETAAAPLQVVDVRIAGGGDRPRVVGRVLTERQRRHLELLAESHGGTADLEVVADPRAHLEEGWLGIERELVDVWREPAAIGNARARQTQYLPGDGPLRLLGRADGVLLVQGPDLAMGWTGPEGLLELAADLGRAAWEGAVRAAPDAAVLPQPALVGGHGGDFVSPLLAAGRAVLGTPYLWGGTTPAGYDCSGLMQRVFHDATGVLLPKHTGDQRHTGLRVISDERRAGDLLFATPRERKVGHVMLLTSADSVLHASVTEGRVVEEPLGENRLTYLHQGIRRPVLLVP